MSEIQTDARVKRHVDRWREIVPSRMKGQHAKPWDRTRFLTELWADVPDLDVATAAGLADGFERAVREARGSMARFRKAPPCSA